MGIENTPVHSEPLRTPKSIATDTVKYTVHGFVMTLALAGFEYYTVIVSTNMLFGNRIPYLPLLLLVCLPLVLILLGGLNRAATERLWNYKSSNSWLILLIQGVVLPFVMMFISILIMMIFHVPVDPILLIGMFVLYPSGLPNSIVTILFLSNVIMVPFVGVVCKAVLKVLMDIAKGMED
ncbi:MAG: hypothetical protein ACFFCP_10275 [Promethearchaeota archaeon]